MRKRLLLIGGLAVAGVLTAGGVAYAVAGDPTPETRYVQVVEGDEAAPNTSADREDCPEKQASNSDSDSSATTTERL